MKLLEPAKLGNLELKNHVFMAPMGTSTDLDGGFNERNIAYYTERAKGGVGLLFTSANLVTDKYESRAGNMLNDFQHVERLHIIANNLHHYGAKLCVQISAGLGRMGLSDPFTPPCAPSAIPSFWFPSLICKPLEVAEIKDIVARTGYSASLAKAAGADALELHAYGGYLLDQFMSGIWNHRTDEYGGSLKGRMKFTLESIEAIQQAVGKNFPVIVKFTPYHGIPGGREMDEGLEIAHMLEEAGVTALHVDLGCYECWYNAIPTVYQPDACDIPYAQQIKNAVKIPVLGQGKLGKPEVAESVLQAGELDLVGLGHTMICDPHWLNKLKNGFTYDLVPCIGCNECLYGDFSGIGCHCAINPLCGYENDYPLIPVAEKKKVLVIGGGPGGMEAAIAASERGIEVELWEKSNALGGTLLAAGAPSFKKDVMDYVQYMVGKLYRSNVTVRLFKEATLKEIEYRHFDAVIVACGARPIIPRIPGVDKSLVKTSTDVLTGKEKAGVKSVVIGGGLVGCETALSIIQDHGGEVTIVEVLDDLLLTVDHSKNNDLKLRDMIAQAGLKSICGAKVTEIGDNYVLYERNGKEESLACDTVVLACGYKANNELIGELSGLGCEVVNIGDSVAPRKVYQAVHEAYHAARLLFSKG